MGVFFKGVTVYNEENLKEKRKCLKKENPQNQAVETLQDAYV